MIHGPTGFGKSTLAAQWAKQLTAEGVAVAWLTVDHDDNNVVWFLSHLIEAIRAVTPALATELGEVLEEHGDEAERYVLTSLINEIHQSGTRMTLVIDDWQRVTDPATIGALLYLLVYASDDLTVVVTSRSQSGLPMSRMRMQDELVEIDATALRFDVAESENFLVELSGLDLDHADVEELTAKTDGWVAALQLASLSLRGRDDPVRLIGTMTGRHHAISEFLAENVLDTLEPSMLDFLLATSITERICGDLASALSGVPDGQAMLEQVEERDLFLRRIDEQWFRYHQLFLDFLRHRLGRDEPERVVRLHRVASTWFAEHQLVSEAVDHALAAGDEERAVQLVENDGIELVANSQMATLIGLVGKLPPAVVQSDPRLQLALAWANIVLHRIPAAEHALALMESGLRTSGLSDDEIADVRAEGGVVRGVADLRSDRLAGIDEHIAPCLARRDRLRPFAVGVAATVATFAAAYHYDLDEVNRIQAWAAPYAERNRDTFNMVHGLCYTGLAHRLMLDIPTAETCFRKALKIAKRSGGSHSYTARLASSALGELLYERGDLDEADRLLEEGYKLGPEGGSVDFKIARYVIAARIKALQGDRHAAGQRLDEAIRVARALSLKRLRAMAEHERTRLGLPPHPDSDPWPPTSYESRRQPVDAIDEITVQFEEASAIRLLIDADDPDKRELACRWAQEWVDRTASPNRPQALLRARRLLGCEPVGRRTRRRGEGHDRDRRGAMRAVGDVALPRRRRSVCRRNAFGIAGRSAVRSVAPRMARDSDPISSTKRSMPKLHSGFDRCAADEIGVEDEHVNRCGRYCARNPPSTGSTAPVMKEASSEARKRMALATSADSPIRPIGCIRSTAARYSEPPGSSGNRMTRSVRIVPGATALTLIPRSAHSTARCLVSPVATNLAGP